MHQTDIYRSGGHAHTYSMENQPSISVQLTATSAMGILKHWAIYRSSTSKALWQAGEKSTAVVQQLHYNGSIVLLFLGATTAVHSLGFRIKNMDQKWRCSREVLEFSHQTKQMSLLSSTLESLHLQDYIWWLGLLLALCGIQPVQSKQPRIASIKASVLPDDTSEGLCGRDSTITASHHDHQLDYIKASVLPIRPRGGGEGVTCRRRFSRSCCG